MIKKIKICGIASYDDVGIEIDTNKKINLIYGHNGTGKSTIANYLQEPNHPDYSDCSSQYSNTSPPEVLVYNQRFIEKQFYESDNQPGVFTLSERNKDAESIIEDSQKSISALKIKQPLLVEEITKLEQIKTQALVALKKKVWKTKLKYAQTPLEFCLEGFKNDKGKFLEKIRRSSEDNSQGIEEKLKENAEDNSEIIEKKLKKEAGELNDQISVEKQTVSIVLFDSHSIECNPIFQEVIAGSQESSLFKLIQQIGSFDWVKQGQPFLAELGDKCPFCQKAIPANFGDEIQKLFDTSYNSKMALLKILYENYQSNINALEIQLNTENFKDEYVTSHEKFELTKIALLRNLKSNLLLIEQKIATPSTPIQLEYSSDRLENFNDCIAEITDSIIAFNDRIQNKNKHLAEIKNRFWSMIKTQCKNAILAADIEIFHLDNQIQDKQISLTKIKAEIIKHEHLIKESRSKTTNIDLSIENINNRMTELGLHGFRLEKETEDSTFYHIIRSNSQKVYKSLSEGEKTLVTFLYFLECCKGNLSQGLYTAADNRIIVIDDPVSSLSHNYIYDIASLIQYEIIEAKFKQVFILTHSLFFLHELVKLKGYCKAKELKNQYQFYRVTKNEFTLIKEMNEKEIKNDYQSYWEIIKDCLNEKTSSVVLPNVMRNILEYYFSFIHKQEGLKDALEEIGEEESEFKPLLRYISRESHSDSINIYDFGLIEATRYIEKFKLVFEKTGFLEHYNKMMGDSSLAEENGELIDA